MLANLRNAFLLVPSKRRTRFVLVGLMALVVTALEAISAIFILIVLRLVVDPGQIPTLPVIGDLQQLFPSSTYEQFVLAGALAFGIFFALRAFVFLLQQYAVARVVENTGVLIADELVQGYLAMPYEFHVRRNSSELIRNVYDSVQQLISSVFMPLSIMFAEAVLVLGLLGVLLVTSPLMTLAATLFMGGLVAVSLLGVQPRLRNLGRERQAAATRTLQSLQQGFQGVRDIKVLGREHTFARSFHSVRTVMARAQYQKSALLYVPRVMLETSFLLAILAALAIAARQGEMSSLISTLGLFAYAGLRIQPSLQKIAMALNNVRYSEAAAEDLRHELLLTATFRAKLELTIADEPLAFTNLLEVRDVSFRYAGAGDDALSHVDFEFRRGESIGICGETGGGKTTLLDLLCGLLLPTNGRIAIDGVTLGPENARAWRHNIGVVHQSSFLIDDTLRRNIALGVRDDEVDGDAVAESIKIAQLEDFVAELPDGLDTIVGESGARLSGGQRQRVTLARALYRRPAVLVLDEGTSALDNATETRIMQHLLGGSEGTTLVMVAHRLSTIERCDRIVYIEAGKVAAKGTYTELMTASAGFRDIAS